MRTAKETTLSLALFTTESQNNCYLARLYKWIINLTYWIGTVIAGTKFIWSNINMLIFFSRFNFQPDKVPFKACNQSTFTGRE